MVSAKFKLGCMRSIQIIIICSSVALTSLFIYALVSYVTTNNVVDQYSNISQYDMDCQVLRCKAYREMPDRLTCCDAFGNECSRKAECLAALQQDADNLSILLYRSILAMILGHVLFIWLFKKLKEKAELTQIQALVEEVQRNNEEVRRDLEEFRIRYQLGGRNGGQDQRRNESAGGTLLTESFIAPNSDTCAICLDDYGEQRVVRLQCEHMFHRQCIQKWRQVRNNCPLCRNIQH